jgi:hypothetical protein
MDKINKREITVNKIHRKKFFESLGTGFFGFMVFNSFPFKFLSSRERKEKEISIRINPLAISRKKTKGKNA